MTMLIRGMSANAAYLFVLFVFAFLGPAHAGDATWNEQNVKLHCANEWPNDFSMQDYCVSQNKSGYRGYMALASGNKDPEMKPAFSNCQAEWGIQWDMVEYCAKQQVSGKSDIAMKLDGLPDDVAAVIETQCRSEWRNDFSMVAYCAEQNASGWRNLNN